MATNDLYGDIPEYSAEAQANARRRKIAEAMFAQAQTPLESMGVAGGAPIPISWTQGLAQLAAAYVADRKQKEADQAEKDLAARYQTDRAGEYGKIADLLSGTPAAPARPAENYSIGDTGDYAPPSAPDASHTLPEVAAKPPSVDAAVQAMLKSRFPELQQQALGLQAMQLKSGLENQRLQEALKAAGMGTTPQSAAPATPSVPTALSGNVPGLTGDFASQGFKGDPMAAMRLIAKMPDGPDKIAATNQLLSQFAADQPAKPAPAGGISALNPLPLLASSSPAAQAIGKMAQDEAFRNQQARLAAQERDASRKAAIDAAAAARPEPAPITTTNDAGDVTFFDRQGNVIRTVPGAGKRNAAGVAPDGSKLTEGQKAADREFGKAYADYQAGGGSADVEKQLQQLQQVSNDLAKPGNDYTGSVRGLVPDKIRSITNPEAVAAKNKVEEVAQRNLRLVLGAQFTQVEGERLIARAYNDQMPPAENKRRVDALIKQIRTAAATKEDAARYFEQHGTLAGWQGRMPTLSDFDAAISAADKTPSAGGGLTPAEQAELEQLRARFKR